MHFVVKTPLGEFQSVLLDEEGQEVFNKVKSIVKEQLAYFTFQATDPVEGGSVMVTLQGEVFKNSVFIFFE